MFKAAQILKVTLETFKIDLSVTHKVGLLLHKQKTENKLTSLVRPYNSQLHKQTNITEHAHPLRAFIWIYYSPF